MQVKITSNLFFIYYKRICIYGWEVFLVDGNPLEYY